MTDRFRVVPAAYVYLVRPGADAGSSDEVLLQLRQHTGYMDGHWAAAAAGHVERDETAYDAARREAREEIDVDDLALEFVTSMQRTQHADPIDERIDFFFTARSWAGEPRVVEPAKCAALRWFPLSALPDPVVPHEREVLTRLGVGLPPYTTYGFTTTSSKEHAMAHDLGGAPTPETEPAEPLPGGVDAIGEEDEHPLVPDLPVEDNPALEHAAPDELAEAEDTGDVTSDGASEPEKEAPA